MRPDRATPRRRRAALLAAATAVPVAAVVALSPPAHAKAAVSVRADTNRDGRVDLAGTSDEAGKTQATATRGALFLPNLDDDGGRCGSTAACTDASDNTVNGAEDAKDLALVQTVPLPGAGAGATATVTVAGSGARVFVRDGAGWSELTAGRSFDAAALRAGLTLGVEGRDIVRDPARWDGTARVTVSVSDGGAASSDTVALRVAPLLTHAHTQPNEQLTMAPGRGAAFDAFKADINRAAGNAGMPRAPHVFGDGSDVWAQDWYEPAYVSVPREGGAQQMRLYVRSDQQRSAQQQLYRLRGRDVGVVQLRGGTGGGVRRPDTFSSFGNLETIPPYRHGDRSFPAGRIILGQASASEGPSAATRGVFAAQGMQAPLVLDSGWLLVGHVDEFLTFLPAGTPRGWKLGVADPLGAVAAIRRAAGTAHGGTPLSSHREFGRTTVAAFLNDRRAMAAQETAAREIDANVATLKAETGLTDAEIVRIPTLYVEEGSRRVAGPVGARHLDRLAASLPPDLRARLADATPRQRRAILARGGMGALLPAAVNSVLATPTRAIVARQWGPVIGGRDVLAEAVTAAYAGAGITVEYVDDFTTYHRMKGEVHCATNSLRAMPPTWWGTAG
ncbi:MAG TPA: protein-arginine deiminase family protein [Pilimelia sp.]|nr:protein-arginine deiminase family protein [Pilimelia sp.]